ncbi:tRNA 2'-phosphotransferase 1 like protein [Argiope bruennichi]|uniref:2'-phosphotransferase n=1 Tax=Argiope bruennichi TaxID=94029 RepID=A0A8T0EXU6_ARGBR|nr:tRNA 2'-phosphotransferase 1 like protein [Argiope bruennichi]
MENVNKQRDIKLSKSLSWLLRHGAESQGLILDEGGFIDVQKILNLKQFKNFTVDDIKRVVVQNDKKRFTLRYKENENCLQIRANQGHTLKVDDDALLNLLTEENVPHVVYHGTYLSKLKNIKQKGLSRMKRNHIHFISKFPGEGSVISGMRSNCEVVICIDTLRAMKDGFKFYKSDNEVILCPGDNNGLIPLNYFKEIWQLSPLQRLD